MTTTAAPQWDTLPVHAQEVRRVREAFIEAYGREPDGVWSAPGRLNLLGEYIDFWAFVHAHAVAVPHLCGGVTAA